MKRSSSSAFDSFTDQAVALITVCTAALVAVIIQTDKDEINRTDSERPARKVRRKETLPRRKKAFGPDSWKSSNLGRMILDPESADPATRAGKLFRQRLRVPYAMFLELVHETENAPFWKDVRDMDCTKRERIPAKILVAASLRHLGKGHDFSDSIRFDTNVSEGTLINFHHQWTAYMAGPSVFGRYIRAATTKDEIAHALSLYETLGVPGCLGSIDVVHIPWERCPVSDRSFFVGKAGFPTIAFNVTSVRGRITNVSAAHAGALNDKTAVRLDDYVMTVKNKQLYQDVEWNYYTLDGQVLMGKGAYLICDGGYHRWRCLQCPTKWATSSMQVAWSKWIESVRKDVECVFGRIKGRFRANKIPCQFQSKDKVVNQFKTCCVLHNRLHDSDFGKAWEMDWLGEDGLFTTEEQQKLRDRMAAQITKHAQRVSGTVTEINSHFDESGVGVASAGFTSSEVQVETESAWQGLRQCLVESFTYAYKTKLVLWVGA